MPGLWSRVLNKCPWHLFKVSFFLFYQDYVSKLHTSTLSTVLCAFLLTACLFCHVSVLSIFFIPVHIQTQQQQTQNKTEKHLPIISRNISHRNSLHSTIKITIWTTNTINHFKNKYVEFNKIKCKNDHDITVFPWQLDLIPIKLTSSATLIYACLPNLNVPCSIS